MVKLEILGVIQESPKNLDEISSCLGASKDYTYKLLKRLERSSIVWYNQTDDKYEIRGKVITDL